MTHAEMFAETPDYWRLVAVFPLNGRTSDAYTIWHHAHSDGTDIYAVCDNHGFNYAMSRTFGAALDHCTRNCGWGELADML
jgi:hypothetical protein